MIIHSHCGRWLKAVKQLLVGLVMHICAVCGVNPRSDDCASFGKTLVNYLHLVVHPTLSSMVRLDSGFSDTAKCSGPRGNKEPLNMASGAAKGNQSSHDHEAQWKQEKKGGYFLTHAYRVRKSKQFLVSQYLVGYPFAMGAVLRVSKSYNCVNFNGFARMDAMISGPTGLARTLRGVLAWWMIKVGSGLGLDFCGVLGISARGLGVFDAAGGAGQGRDCVESGRRVRGGWCFAAVATRPGRPCYGSGRSGAGGGIGEGEWTVLTVLTVLT